MIRDYRFVIKFVLGQTSALTPSLDELKGSGEQPSTIACDWPPVWVICISLSCMVGSEIRIQYVLSSSAMGPPRLVIKCHFPFTSTVPDTFQSLLIWQTTPFNLRCGGLSVFCKACIKERKKYINARVRAERRITQYSQ